MDSKRADKLLRALANKKRIEIVMLLSDDKARSVSEIAHDIKLSFKATSKHLARLVQAEYLDHNRVSLYMLYEINETMPKPQRSLLTFLLQTLHK